MSLRNVARLSFAPANEAHTELSVVMLESIPQLMRHGTVPKCAKPIETAQDRSCEVGSANTIYLYFFAREMDGRFKRDNDELGIKVMTDPPKDVRIRNP